MRKQSKNKINLSMQTFSIVGLLLSAILFEEHSFIDLIRIITIFLAPFFISSCIIAHCYLETLLSIYLMCHSFDMYPTTAAATFLSPAHFGN